MDNFEILDVDRFPEPPKNIKNSKMVMRLPDRRLNAPSHFNIQASKKILEDVGGYFCMFLKEEKEAIQFNLPNNWIHRKVVWKKYGNGIREMCDVCKTTIFNHHWSCSKCGFEVCVDCFKTKLKSTLVTTNRIQRNVNKQIWLLCSNQEEHQVENLSMTQMLTDDALKNILYQMHHMCNHFNIPLNCSCNFKLKNICHPNSSTDYVTEKFLNNAVKLINSDDTDDDKEETSEMQTIIKDERLRYSNLRRKCKIKRKIKTHILSENIEDKICAVEPINIFIPKLSLFSDSKNYSAPHKWLCEGNVLWLTDSKNDKNYTIFQDQWKRGQPVLVSNVGNKLKPSLWNPKSFSRDFGNNTYDLIDCTTGEVISDQPLRKFWNGFENYEERLCDKQGNVMLLKLKDWPPLADFAKTLPNRFQDLMDCLPLKEYTHRFGKYNLASSLPKYYVQPDLGPKMYTAYGNAGTEHQNVSTTNLHLDMTDAVNVMVYVAITNICKKFDYHWHVREALKVIEEAGCDDLTKTRSYMANEIPGALWHIYHASDAESIRDLLIKVSVEKRMPIQQFSDPIHDQSHYLDENLRHRLFTEYNVKGYAIVQYYGDAIFIPAGAPHQVRNLHNCIKVAEDFVSPETIHYSFRMTQEFRNLSDSHTNHEDKLQIKNIVFNVVKDSLAVLIDTTE